MKICLVGSILRHIVTSDAGTHRGWGGMTESAVAPFAPLLPRGSTLYFVGNLGKEDIDELKEFYNTNYPFVDTSGIGINPSGTDLHRGTKDFSQRTVQVEPTQYKQIEPFARDADVVIFNFGNIDDIDPEAIIHAKKNSKAFVYVDIHRKPFGADENGYMYPRGWDGWENYLGHADAVQMNKDECQVLFQKEILDMDGFVECARAVLDAGARYAIITLRNQGALLANRLPSSEYEYVHIPAVPCDVIDLGGCGDAFAAGFLVGLHEGKTPIEAAKLGSVVAGLTSEFVGYIKGVTRETIEKWMPPDFEHVVIRRNSSSSQASDV